MDEKTIATLLALNRRFYTDFAGSFAASRSPCDPALTRILPAIALGARVLDVGCGDGRLATLLERERPGCAYVGVDVVPELLALARNRAADLAAVSAHFALADVAQPGWSQALRAAGWPWPFDVAVMLAVLHHLPGFERRAAALREVADQVAPDGLVIVSTWQFMDSPRLRRKLVGWEQVGLATEALEPGDYLLDWRRGGLGLRYCHMVDEHELAELARRSKLQVCETFRAGGREGNLSLFALLRPEAPAAQP